jgi:alpha-beta hydrolase superfamily lysophospholipase
MGLQCLYCRVVVLVAVLVVAGAFVDVAAKPSDDVEQTVCGWILERAAFAVWSAVAGRPNPNAWKSVPGAEPNSYRTRDGRTLHGYKISASSDSDASSPSPGFVLFAQGNAMLADHLLGVLSNLANQGLEVYVYDYRGYGESEGNRRLKAIASDYREIFAALSAANLGRKFLYGVSFGGIVMLHVIGGGAEFDKAVIDSTPSRLSQWGCPEEYDPVHGVPADSSRLMIMSGQRDGVVKPAEQTEFLSAAESRRARVVISEEFAHPFLDSDPSIHQQRQKLVVDFLLEAGQ